MKKYLLGVFAIVLAIGFSAFTSTNTGRVFVHIQEEGKFVAIENYSVTQCESGTNYCAVQEDEFNLLPVSEFLVSDLEDYIDDVEPLGDDDKKYIIEP